MLRTTYCFIKTAIRFVFVNLTFSVLFGEVVFPPTGEEITELNIPLKGSTSPTLVEYNGALFVKKKGANASHCINEFQTIEAYIALGANVPQAKLYETKNEGLFLLKEFIEGVTLREYIQSTSQKEAEKIFKKVQKDFIADCVLANWDAVGYDYNNIIIDSNGTPWRIDHGGGLSYQPGGNLKGENWGPIVKELKTLRQRKKFKAASTVYSTLSANEIKEQVLSLESKQIKLLNALSIKDRPIVAARIQNLKNTILGKKQGPIIRKVKPGELPYEIVPLSLPDGEDFVELLAEFPEFFADE